MVQSYPCHKNIIMGLKTTWRNVRNDYRQTSKGKKVQALPKPLFAQLLNDKGFQSDQVKYGEVEDTGIIEKECDNESQEIEREVIVIEALVHQPLTQHAKTPAGEVSKTFKNQAVAKDMRQEIEMVNEESTDITSEVILMDEEIIEEYVVDKASGELQVSTTEKCAGKGDVEVPKIEEGAYCIFTEEGSLFQGRMQKINPLQVCVLQQNFLGGWVWPFKIEICRISEANIISVLQDKQVSRKGGHTYIDDDILLMEWG